MNYETAAEIEIALARYFRVRRRVIVPNVSWGLDFNHELDLLMLSEDGYASEVEIKVSRSDLVRDLKKRHGHAGGGRIKYLWFAMPQSLERAKDLVPERAGIVLVSATGVCSVTRRPRPQPARAFTADEKFGLVRLGMLRYWDLRLRNMHYRDDSSRGDITSEAVTEAVAEPSQCVATRDGDCFNSKCPQLRDGEPSASGRACPLLVEEVEF